MSNIRGKAYAMNTVSPMKPWKTPFLRGLFLLLRLFPGLNHGLIDLSFIHFARWVIVPRHAFPRLSDQQPKDKLQYDYLLFFSNFNGTWNQYIDAFSAVLNTGLNAIWRWSEKFPGSVPVTPFKNYITRGQIGTGYYYTAYPQATTNDVKAAHRVQAALDDLEARSTNLTPDKLGEEYLKFVAKVQNDLGATGKAPVGV